MIKEGLGKVRIFLFLYPIKEYIEAAEDLFWGKLHPDLSSSRLSAIIDARYRRRGYKIVWLLFGEDGQPLIPDINRMSSIFQAGEGDAFISCGVSFKDHTAKRIYPNPDLIFSQLPNPLEEVVVGGFHQWDCVDKTAGDIFWRGVACRVDEDATELFFTSAVTDRPLPLIRRKGDTPLSRLLKGGASREWAVELIRESRQNRPWFEQVDA